jgi:hypothetical protein
MVVNSAGVKPLMSAMKLQHRQHPLQHPHQRHPRQHRRQQLHPLHHSHQHPPCQHSLQRLVSIHSDSSCCSTTGQKRRLGIFKTRPTQDYLCIDDGEYAFTIYDYNEDGMCCRYGNGHYYVVKHGGSFGVLSS